ncbi:MULTISPECIES: hypothetical protein [Microbacterium]|uniref:hypothetical protein n=1 Tax=Microbacterium TaxID=33882 RepID=UPI0027883EF9|nr:MULTISPECIES: hypothetical protein [Microbacterium]MDQ1084850.1 hypothetical protein [Microbacterium sp. SORGH_AS_0344]MDQ1169870.1 hypothetical protein [Microbacterium proteolyticum]
MKSVAWIIISAMGILILWTVVVPWGEKMPGARDVEGVWRFVDSSGHTVTMKLGSDSIAELSGWPDSVGCAGPVQSSERLLKDVDWRAISDFRGEWMLRTDFGGLSLQMSSSSSGDCLLDVPLRFQWNIITGENRILFYVSGYDEPFFDQVFTFSRLNVAPDRR